MFRSSRWLVDLKPAWVDLKARKTRKRLATHFKKLKIVFLTTQQQRQDRRFDPLGLPQYGGITEEDLVLLHKQ